MIKEGNTILEERQNSYGSYKDNVEKIEKLVENNFLMNGFGAYMLALKLVRLHNHFVMTGKWHEDSIVDFYNYLRLERERRGNDGFVFMVEGLYYTLDALINMCETDMFKGFYVRKLSTII